MFDPLRLQDVSLLEIRIDREFQHHYIPALA